MKALFNFFFKKKQQPRDLSRDTSNDKQVQQALAILLKPKQ